MKHLLNIMGPACALLALAALLAASARADVVTTAECKARGTPSRLRRHPTDSEASYFSMTSCELSEINRSYQNIFKGLPKLKAIDLGDNHIENIDPDAFHTVSSLTSLLLSRNKLRNLPVFDKRSCANLTHLTLFRNQLTDIEKEETFSACVKLTWLCFTRNHIEFIHPNVFKQLTELEYLYLDNNKIRSIPDQMFVNNGKLAVLELNNNRITHLPPDFASSLKRASPTLRSFRFYHNPWRCVCLLELLVDINKSRATECPLCYDGTRPVCVHINASRSNCRDITELSALLFEREWRP